MIIYFLITPFTDFFFLLSFNGEYVYNMVRFYCMSLPFSVKHVYETLPKLFSLWLDFAETIKFLGDNIPFSEEWKREIIKQRLSNLKKINDFLLKYIPRIPCFIVSIFFVIIINYYFFSLTFFFILALSIPTSTTF